MICSGFRNADFGAEKDTKIAINRVLLLGLVTNQVYFKGSCKPDLSVDVKVLCSTQKANYRQVCMICSGFRNADWGA